MTDWKKDKHRQENTITKVEPIPEGGGWSITSDDGWSLWVSSDECQVAPIPTEIILTFGKGLGYAIRGIVIADRVYRYQTEAEHKADALAKNAEAKAKRDQEALEERPERDKKIEALPQPLVDRIRRFQRVNDDFCASHEPYELFVCEQAAIIAKTLGAVDQIIAFQKDKTDEQKRLVPDLDYADHSGNTFGAACLLARLLLDHPELVIKAHGALCPLVGCKEYGCWAAGEEAASSEP